jgi:hypothetical protein
MKYSKSISFFVFSVILFSSFSLIAQKKKPVIKPKPITNPNVVNNDYKIVSYELSEYGDTINRMDDKKRKQGKWLQTFEARYGESGYMEYGNYVNDMRVGQWQTYELNGDLLSDEFYKSGHKDGEARYFEMGNLLCVGNYLALKSKQVLDTIMVEDPVTNQEKSIIIKTEVGSVRHGIWQYYKPGTMKLQQVIEYQADEIIYTKDYTNEVDSTYMNERKKTLPHVSKKPTVNAWMQDKNKKGFQYTDLPTDLDKIKPNVKQKSTK